MEAEQSLAAGKITENEYMEILSSNASFSNSISQMDALYNQNLSIRGNPENAHFLFDKNWKKLLFREEIPLLLILGDHFTVRRSVSL